MSNRITASVTGTQRSAAQLGVRVDAVVRRFLTHARVPILDMQRYRNRSGAKAPDAKPIFGIPVLGAGRHQEWRHAK